MYSDNPNEDSEENENEGILFSLLKRSPFEPVLREYIGSIKRDISKEGKLNLLSPECQDEYVRLLGNNLKEKMVADIKKAGYFGILFETTLNAEEETQLCEVIRYVHIEGGKVAVKESFLSCFLADRRSDAELAEAILGQLHSDGLDINLCRGQGYDRMVGFHSAIQATNQRRPCANHSLNHCALYSFQRVVLYSVAFLRAFDNMYSFFAVTRSLWGMLWQAEFPVEMLDSMLNGRKIRRSTHREAVQAVKTNFENLVSTLEKEVLPNYSLDALGLAEKHLDAMCDFSFVTFLYFWCDALEQVDPTQKYLQTPGASLEQCTAKLRALKRFFEEQRTEMVEAAIQGATTKCEAMGISTEEATFFSRRRKPNKAPEEDNLTLPEKLRKQMFECLDFFLQELDVRCTTMDQIMSVFAIIQPSALIFAEETELRGLLPNIIEMYEELSGEGLLMEIFQLRRRLEGAGIDPEAAKVWPTLQYLEFIVQQNFLESVPNLALCLKLFLIAYVSVASCERDIDKSELIKSVIGSKESSDRLADLAIMAIEQDYADKIDRNKVVDEFIEAHPNWPDP